MARIFLDTEDLQATARQFAGITGELSGVLARLPADAATVMPPGVLAEVAGAVADTEAGVGHVAGRLTGHAMDLERRAIFAAASEGGGFRAGGLGAPGRFGPFGVPGRG